MFLMETFLPKRSAVLFVLGLPLLLAGCGGSSKPIAVTITASATTVDAGNSITLTVTVANDSASSGVNWSVSGGGTLTNTTPTSATYNAPAPSSTAVTATVTATSIKDSTKSTSITINVPAAPAISTGGLASATVGTAYSATLAASGGIPPYTWTLTSGTLPVGLTMTSAGSISGIPMASAVGTSNLTFKVTDSGTPNPLTATANLAITINAAPPITFSSATLADATFNASYSASVAAAGGAGTLTYSLTAGALPTGLTLSSAGAITGTPTVVGTFPITVKAADAFGDSATQAFTLVVKYPALVITAATLPTGYVSSAYASTTLQATGGSGTGFTWTLANSTTLPAGLSMSTAGVITGTPTAAGTTNFTVKVTDSASNTATLAMSIVVKPAVSITTTSPLATGYVGSAYSQTFAATGGSGTGYTWAIASGSSAPAGLSLSSAGVLSGTPTTTGSPSFTVKVTDSASNTATATFAMTISAGVSITTASLPDGYQNGVYAPVTMAATGGSGAPYTWTWAAAGGSSLPAGMQLSTAGVLSGTPTGSGNFNVVITAKDGVNNTASVTFTLKVQAALTITTGTTLPSGTVNVAYSQALAASGGSGTGYTWTTSGTNTLATVGLSFNTSTGTVAGTPSATGTASFTATVTDSQSHTAQATFSVTVYNSLTITTASLPAGSVGTAYSQTLNAGGGTGTGYTWTATSSNLSTYGLSLSSAGVVSGTPTQAGTATFTANVTDSGSHTATQALTILIYGTLSLPNPSTSIPGPGTTGVNYSATIAATGGSGNYCYTVSGLPSGGLTGPATNALCAAGGGAGYQGVSGYTIVGTPTPAATITFSLTVRDTTTSLTVTKTYSVVVTDPAPLVLPAPNPSTLPSATVNTAYNGTIVATGGVAPYTWKVNTVSVPTNQTPIALSNGLSVTNDGTATLKVTGTPTSTGSVTISASITDSLSHTAGANAYSVSVNAAGSQVSGNIQLANNCGNVSLPTFSVSINTTPVQTVQTDSNGNYSFASVPNGTYTITPSITGPTAVFLPATLANVVVNNASVNNQSFQVALGYTVSGAVSYSGSSTGRVYVGLNLNNCGGNSTVGTSLSAAGSYTIRGVPPGSYTLSTWMDTIGTGSSNTSDPSGTASSAVTVSNANVTGANVNLLDPNPLNAPASNPKFQAVSATATGVVITFSPVTVSINNNKVESATSYVVQWSTDPTFSSPSSFTFPARGTGGANVWILNDGTAGIVGNFDHGPYYFRAQARNSAGSASGYSYFGTQSSPTSVTIAAPSGGNTISGTVTFTGTATGPLYVGFYDATNAKVYATRIAAPTSPQAFSVNVPTGSSYYFFGTVDQNNNGLFDVGDITNTNGKGISLVAVSASGTMDLTLPSANSAAVVTTQNMKFTYYNGSGATTSTGASLNFDIRQGQKLPIKVTLTSGPNVVAPVDLTICTSCGESHYSYSAGIGSVIPSVGDSYAFNVTYSDSTSETINASVTAFLTGFATNLSPLGNTSNLQPTFSWTDPANASSYIYQFQLWDHNGSNIWNVPSNNSNRNGFTSSTTSLTWGVDPNDSSNTPTVSSLTAGQVYNWQITVQDADGNQTQRTVYFIP